MPILLVIILTALFVNGLQIATEEGMLLHFIKQCLDKIFITQKAVNRHKTISKWYYPILYCVRCMPSVYGTAICLLILPIEISLLWQIPLVILCSVSLATIIHSNYV